MKLDAAAGSTGDRAVASGRADLEVGLGGDAAGTNYGRVALGLPSENLTL